MFEVSVEESFSAGHALRGYKGKCENPHGHNYKVQVTLEGMKLDEIGLLCDFAQLRRIIRAVMAELDHKFLNEVEPFNQINPSAENIAKYFYDEAARQLARQRNGARIRSVTVWETDEATATYRPEGAGLRPQKSRTPVVPGPVGRGTQEPGTGLHKPERQRPRGRSHPRPAKAGR
jgi:6-pyruvoyltetrahydropterin/6-carboxytetrahydropterin synthase